VRPFGFVDSDDVGEFEDSPFLIPWSWSLVRARARSRKVSTMAATAVSDWTDADGLDPYHVVARGLHGR